MSYRIGMQRIEMPKEPAIMASAGVRWNDSRDARAAQGVKHVEPASGVKGSCHDHLGASAYRAQAPRAGCAAALAVLPQLAGVLSALALIGTLLVSFGRGFEWSDEGFYLLWLASPRDFPVSVTQFGFVYHPLFLLVDGNIILLRCLNLLATIILAAIVAVVALPPAQAQGSKGQGVWAAGWSALPVASLALVFYQWLPPTPSYNSLTLQALLITTIAVALLLRSRWESMRAWVLLAAGIALCSLAKPSTALALSVVLVAWLLLTHGWRNFPMRGALVAAAVLTACMVLAAVLIDGSPAAFVRRLTAATDDVRILQSGQSLAPLGFIFKFDLDQTLKRNLVVLGLAAAAGVLAGWSLQPGRFSGWIRACITGVLIAGLLAAFLMLWGFVRPVDALRLMKGTFVAFAAGALVAAVLAHIARSKLAPPPQRFSFAAFLLALPVAYAFGTNLPVWVASANAAYFWLAVPLTLFPAHQFRDAYVLLAQTLVVSAVALHLYQPYRQSEPLLTPKSAVDVPWKGGTKLGLSQDSADYARALSGLAAKGGFRAGTMVVDLTGRHPAVAYFLGGKAPSTPWLLGRYRGSEAWARMVLGRVSCEDLAHAWVLTEPEGPERLPIAVLLSHGIRAQSLEPVGNLMSPSGPPGGGYAERFAQTLYRPLQPSGRTVEACRNARAAQPAYVFP
jgi:hypothetical protein